jgi:hypothetical protein
MSQIPHASWLAGSHIWLIGIPALQLFYQARLRRRTGFAWLISPFFIFATAGIAVELMQPFSLPIGTRIYFLLRIIFFGLIISFLIHLFSGRIKELFSDTAHSGLRRVRVRKGGNDD